MKFIVIISIISLVITTNVSGQSSGKKSNRDQVKIEATIRDFLNWYKNEPIKYRR